MLRNTNGRPKTPMPFSLRRLFVLLGTYALPRNRPLNEQYKQAAAHLPTIEGPPNLVMQKCGHRRLRANFLRPLVTDTRCKEVMLYGQKVKRGQKFFLSLTLGDYRKTTTTITQIQCRRLHKKGNRHSLRMGNAPKNHTDGRIIAKEA